MPRLAGCGGTHLNPRTLQAEASGALSSRPALPTESSRKARAAEKLWVEKNKTKQRKNQPLPKQKPYIFQNLHLKMTILFFKKKLYSSIATASLNVRKPSTQTGSMFSKNILECLFIQLRKFIHTVSLCLLQVISRKTCSSQPHFCNSSNPLPPLDCPMTARSTHALQQAVFLSILEFSECRIYAL